jgi:nucleoside-diphosphate-sugar epimerase
MTGAAGGIGTSLRKLLPPIYPDLLLSDLKAPADLGKNEKFKPAELSDLAQVEAICEGVDGILHFGGYSVEGPWDAIHQSNIIGCYNLFEAARKKGVKRIVFASSNHAVGFYPRHHRIGTDVTPRPDSRYGISKVFWRGGRRALCRQARARGDVSSNRQFRRKAAGSPKAIDLAKTGRSGAAVPDRARSSRHPVRDLLWRIVQRARVV